MDRQDVGTAQIIRGNALDLALADSSVDLIVTSPPYFGLRSYQDGGEHYEGQIGDEATPAEFVDALMAATAEMVRVLKPSGSIWVNLGDKYAGSRMDGSSGNGSSGTLNTRKVAGQKLQVVEIGAEGQGKKARTTVPTKSLIGVPWRYALRCIDDLGLILRAEVIWAKPNGLPESVTDRVRRSHETWFHFTKSPRYFSAVDELREAYEGDGRKRGRSPHTTAGHPNSGGHAGLNLNGNENALGKLPGSVWRISESGSGQGRDGADDRGCTCEADRSGRDRAGGDRRTGTGGLSEGGAAGVDAGDSVWTIPTQPLRVPESLGIDHFAAFPMEWPRRIIKGWAPEDGIVLDPFGGTGTTALVAKALGRHGISNDMSADYCRLATWRTNDEGELARAMQVDKPAEQVKGQASLLDLIGEAAS